MRSTLVLVTAGIVCCLSTLSCSSTFRRIDHPNAYLRIERISPPPGSEVKRSTVVEAEFSVFVDAEKIDYDQLVFTPAFTSKEQGKIFLVGFQGRDRDFVLESPEGVFTIQYPLDKIWDVDPIVRPFRMYFYLINKKFNGDRIYIESTSEIIYHPIDVEIEF